MSSYIFLKTKFPHQESAVLALYVTNEQNKNMTQGKKLKADFKPVIFQSRILNSPLDF
jgi:hypothetical protein